MNIKLDFAYFRKFVLTFVQTYVCVVGNISEIVYFLLKTRRFRSNIFRLWIHTAFFKNTFKYVYTHFRRLLKNHLKIFRTKNCLPKIFTTRPKTVRRGHKNIKGGGGEQTSETWSTESLLMGALQPMATHLLFFFLLLLLFIMCVHQVILRYRGIKSYTKINFPFFETLYTNMHFLCTHLRRKLVIGKRTLQ